MVIFTVFLEVILHLTFPLKLSGPVATLKEYISKKNASFYTTRGALDKQLFFTQKCRLSAWKLLLQSVNYGTIFGSNGRLEAEASVSCLRSN